MGDLHIKAGYVWRRNVFGGYTVVREAGFFEALLCRWFGREPSNG